MKVLVIGDTHLPFEHPNYLKFLRELKEREQPDKVVLIGDFIDHYALSRFSLDPDVQGQRPEFKEALRHARKFYREFPEATWILGNHDRRPYRKAYEIGLGRTWLKDLKDIYECPEGWDIVPDIEIDDVLYTHGEGIGGQTGWQNYPLVVGKSTVAGHFHAVAGTRYHQRPDQSQLFIMMVGSGVDDQAYAFAYGKNSPKKSFLSAGIVSDGKYATLVPMDLSQRKYRRIR